MNPATYWRNNKSWSNWLGQQGMVLGSTYIRVAADGLDHLAPYSFLLVEFDSGERAEFPGVGHDLINIGDRVECVLRRGDALSNSGIVPYSLKLVRVQ